MISRFQSATGEELRGNQRAINRLQEAGMGLDGKVAVITGGGRGIGRRIALRYSAAGASVVISGTSKDALEQTARDVRERGGHANAVIADVAEEAAAEQLIA